MLPLWSIKLGANYTGKITREIYTEKVLYMTKMMTTCKIINLTGQVVTRHKQSCCSVCIPTDNSGDQSIVVSESTIIECLCGHAVWSMLVWSSSSFIYHLTIVRARACLAQAPKCSLSD